MGRWKNEAGEIGRGLIDCRQIQCPFLGLVAGEPETGLSTFKKIKENNLWG